MTAATHATDQVTSPPSTSDERMRAIVQSDLSVQEKGSTCVQIRLVKPNLLAARERRANIRKTPRVPARDRRLRSRHQICPVAGIYAKP